MTIKLTFDDLIRYDEKVAVETVLSQIIAIPEMAPILERAKRNYGGVIHIHVSPSGPSHAGPRANGDGRAVISTGEIARMVYPTKASGTGNDTLQRALVHELFHLYQNPADVDRSKSKRTILDYERAIEEPAVDFENVIMKKYFGESEAAGHTGRLTMVFRECIGYDKIRFSVTSINGVDPSMSAPPTRNLCSDPQKIEPERSR